MGGTPPVSVSQVSVSDPHISVSASQSSASVSQTAVSASQLSFQQSSHTLIAHAPGAGLAVDSPRSYPGNAQSGAWRNPCSIVSSSTGTISSQPLPVTTGRVVDRSSVYPGNVYTNSWSCPGSSTGHSPGSAVASSQPHPAVSAEAVPVYRDYRVSATTPQTFVTAGRRGITQTAGPAHTAVQGPGLTAGHHQQPQDFVQHPDTYPSHLPSSGGFQPVTHSTGTTALHHRVSGSAPHPPQTGHPQVQQGDPACLQNVSAERPSTDQSVTAGVPTQPARHPSGVDSTWQQTQFLHSERTASSHLQVSPPASSCGSSLSSGTSAGRCVAGPCQPSVGSVTQASPYLAQGQQAEGALSRCQQVAGTAPSHPQQVTAPSSCCVQQSDSRSISSLPSTMLEKKPTLQVVTTDHSPVSPGSSTSSPRFIFPDIPSSSSCHLASDTSPSPFMSPVKREVRWEVGSPPQSSDIEQVHRERRRMLSGDTDRSDTLMDSETGSSLLEDSSSSREQSPFSEPPLRSPSQHPPSPLTKRTFPRQTVIMASEDEEQGDEMEGGDAASSSGHETEFHPSKFKKRLHERYMLSLKDTADIVPSVKEEAVDRFEQLEMGTQQDGKEAEYEGGEVREKCKWPVAKWEVPDSPRYPDSPRIKSPRRSVSDTDIMRIESSDAGGGGADEEDVFMEPTTSVRTKHKPPSLLQREPLDLSRGPFFPAVRSSAHADPDHLNPGTKLFSPVFRSPLRLPYSPHGLLSPQAQSPLCSVPEGGRIFNFNVPSPREGAHSDSDLISPSPLSPRIFTFPPPGSILSPMSEVNRLAVSPRAPYTPPPSFLRGKPFGSRGVPNTKCGDDQGFYGKRSLSESDMTCLCTVCGQVFPTNDSLAKHMAKHLPTETVRTGDNKVHYCKVCHRSFSRSDMLTRHMRLHTGLKPYECLDCGQVFSRSDHLNTHRRTHTGEKPYRCPHCPYAACRRDMITRHMRTHVKRTPRRGRYLSVPEDGDAHRPSGSISSLETTDSQDCSTGGHTCSVSSMDSVESESLHPSRLPYLGASIDSLLSPDHDRLNAPPLPSGGNHSLDPGEGGKSHEEGTDYDRFLRYRKGRNWSTTSLESVDSEEASLLREVLVDDAFHDPDPPPAVPGEWRRGEGADQGRKIVTSLASPTDTVGPETRTLQKCFISSPSSGNNS